MISSAKNTSIESHIHGVLFQPIRCPPQSAVFETSLPQSAEFENMAPL